jgi:hypothetical protein
MRPTRTVTRCFRFRVVDYKALGKLAKRRNQSISYTAWQIIVDYLAREQP